MAKFPSQINRAGSGIRSGYTLPSGTTSYQISGRKIISQQGDSSTTIADTEKWVETTITKPKPLPPTVQPVPPPPQQAKQIQPAQQEGFISSNYRRLDAFLGGVLPGGAPPSKFVEEKLTARSKSGGISTFGSVAKSFFSGQVYVEKKLKEKFPKQYGTFERTPILGAKFETSKAVAFVEPILKAQFFAPAFGTGVVAKKKTQQELLTETRFSKLSPEKTRAGYGAIEKKIAMEKSFAKQLKILKEIKQGAKTPEARAGFEVLKKSLLEKGIIKIPVSMFNRAPPGITATRFTFPSPKISTATRKLVFDLKILPNVPVSMKGAGAVTGITASLSRFGGLQEETTSRRLAAMSLAIPVLEGTPIQETVTQTELASYTSSGQKLINVPEQATPTIPKQTTITIPKTVPRSRTPTRIFTKGTTKKPTRRFPKPFWFPTSKPRQSGLFSITKPRRRKAPSRTPSLFALGRGITSPTKGFSERSALTIRPIIVGRRKKRGKKKKR